MPKILKDLKGIDPKDAEGIHNDEMVNLICEVILKMRPNVRDLEIERLLGSTW